MSKKSTSLATALKDTDVLNGVVILSLAATGTVFTVT
jgi:hypothetical protein